MSEMTETEVEHRIRSTFAAVAASTGLREDLAVTGQWKRPDGVRRHRQLAVMAGAAAAAVAVLLAFVAIRHDDDGPAVASSGTARFLSEVTWNGDRWRLVTELEGDDAPCTAVRRVGHGVVASLCGSDVRAPSLSSFGSDPEGSRLHFAVVNPQFLRIRVYPSERPPFDVTTVADPMTPGRRSAVYVVPAGQVRLGLVDGNGHVTRWDDSLALDEG